MGRPPKPLALALADGAYRKNPARLRARLQNEPEGPPIGAPPAHLSDAAAVCWREVAEVAAPGVLQTSDGVALEMLANLLAEHRSSPEALRAGRTRLLLRLFAHCGLTPAARVSLLSR